MSEGGVKSGEVQAGPSETPGFRSQIATVKRPGEKDLIVDIVDSSFKNLNEQRKMLGYPEVQSINRFGPTEAKVTVTSQIIGENAGKVGVQDALEKLAGVQEGAKERAGEKLGAFKEFAEQELAMAEGFGLEGMGAGGDQSGSTEGATAGTSGQEKVGKPVSKETGWTKTKSIARKVMLSTMASAIALVAYAKAGEMAASAETLMSSPPGLEALVIKYDQKKLDAIDGHYGVPGYAQKLVELRAHFKHDVGKYPGRAEQYGAYYEEELKALNAENNVNAGENIDAKNAFNATIKAQQAYEVRHPDAIQEVNGAFAAPVRESHPQPARAANPESLPWLTKTRAQPAQPTSQEQSGESTGDLLGRLAGYAVGAAIVGGLVVLAVEGGGSGGQNNNSPGSVFKHAKNRNAIYEDHAKEQAGIWNQVGSPGYKAEIEAASKNRQSADSDAKLQKRLSKHQ